MGMALANAGTQITMRSASDMTRVSGVVNRLRLVAKSKNTMIQIQGLLKQSPALAKQSLWSNPVLTTTIGLVITFLKILLEITGQVDPTQTYAMITSKSRPFKMVTKLCSSQKSKGTGNFLLILRFCRIHWIVKKLDH